MSTVGICGIGSMGHVALQKLLEEKTKVFAFDVNPSLIGRIEKLSAKTAGSPAEVAEHSDVILMFLPGPSEVRECVAGHAGLLQTARQETVIVDMSTVDPETTCEMAEKAGQKNVGYLDAPVLGRPSAVGNWACPVGGKAVFLEKARPVLELVAGKIFHVGKAGAGNRLKLLNQLMFGAINAMTAEMMAIASKSEIPPSLLYETITSSQAGTVSNLFVELGKRIVEEDYDNPTFSVDLLVKDISLAVGMARESDSISLLGQTITWMNEIAQIQGYGRKDTAVMWKCLLNIWDKKEDS